MMNIKIIHFDYGEIAPIYRRVRSQSTGASTMIITYIVFAFSGLIFTAIAKDEVKDATRKA